MSRHLPCPATACAAAFLLVSGRVCADPPPSPPPPSAASPATDTANFLCLQRTIPLPNGSSHGHLSIAGDNIYVADTDRGTLTVISREMAAVTATVEGLAGIRAFVAVPTENVGFATLGTQNQVAVVDLSANKVVANLDVGKSPDAVLYSAKRNLVYVANDAEGTATLIDPKKREVVGTIDIGGQLAGVCEDPESGTIYQAASDRHEIAVIDLKRKRVGKRWHIRAAEGPVLVAAAPDDGHLYVVMRDGSLMFVSLRDGENGPALPTLTHPVAEEFDSVSRRLYVAGASGELAVLERWGYGDVNETHLRLALPVEDFAVSTDSAASVAWSPGVISVFTTLQRIGAAMESAPNVLIPDNLRRTEIHTRIELKVTIYRDGRHRTEIVKSSGYPELDEEVKKAVDAARFRPAVVDGKPVDVSIPISVPISQH